MIINKHADQEIESVDKLFWDRYKAILKKAIDICEDRQVSYVGDASTILEYWPHGENDLIYEINKKNKRLMGLHALESKKTGITQKTADKVEDTLLDQINYCAYLLAYRAMVETGENIVRRNGTKKPKT